jgi:menaquinone-dependent protoporphyrinogen oxidase
MEKILVTYCTNSGSTAEVAESIAKEIRDTGRTVDVLQMDDARDLDGYSAYVIGAPMILGWHKTAMQFLRKHKNKFQQKPVALFLTAMSLTQTMENQIQGIPITVDPRLPTPPKIIGRLSFKEKYSTPSNYVLPILKQASPAKPVQIGIFGGRLDYARLNIFQMLFVMLIIQATPGEKRNWPVIRSWASKVIADLK